MLLEHNRSNVKFPLLLEHSITDVETHQSAADLLCLWQRNNNRLDLRRHDVRQ